jgi:hypothetical protein
MKRIFTLVLTVLLCSNAFAQSAFLPGYFITEEGRQVDCLIKHADRKHNPTTFDYMLTGESVNRTAAIDTVQEFEILNTVHKYKRFRVDIDRSSNRLSTLSGFRNPDFKSEVLFLRVMVEGTASLFSYHEKDDLERFFFKLGDADVQQLVYKRYYVKDNDISTNEDYKNQLLFALVCGDVVPSKVKRLSYYGKDLADVFVTYNICIGSAYTTMSEKKERGKLGLAVKAGINSSTLQTSQRIPNGHSNYELITNDFERLTTPVVSVEVEYVLPYRNRKWSIFAEPTYQQGKHEMNSFFFRYEGRLDNRRVYYPRREDININYTHISIPMGARYSYHLNNYSRVFVNAAVGFSALLSKSQIYEVGGFENKREFRTIQHFSEPSGTVGLGFKYKNRVSVEGNYHLAKKVANSTGWQINYRDSFNVMLGYTIM